ncbi:hypothetical protein LCGC14_0265050 [marine sediment metagenome]|uniref:Amine oxidase domain-containing protein n=1 Tax=marine sediment metagenome TaxID=412755 RepID=A0A0F9UHV6_9ZZZZ
MRIAILGAGPSGMMAAHAASECGNYVDIFDADPNKSKRNAGVFFLHASCNLPLTPTSIQQRLLGAEGMLSRNVALAYGQKVYGIPSVKNSVLGPRQVPEIQGYNAGTAINMLWDLYGKQVQTKAIEDLHDIGELLREYDRVISTIPLHHLYSGLDYESATLWIRGGKAPDGEAWILYNINEHCDWYRCSAIWGTFTMEYRAGYIPVRRPEYNYFEVTKVVGRRNIPAHSERLLFTGRYGAWDKTILTHMVYDRVLEWLL